MTDTALFAVLLAAIAGLMAGRAWASAQRRAELRDRPAFRTSPHYTQGLHFLAAGQTELAVSELTKVSREDPAALEPLLVLGNLLRETGQVERAIQVHQKLLSRGDLTRAEQIHARACWPGGPGHRRCVARTLATARRSAPRPTTRRACTT